MFISEAQKKIAKQTIQNRYIKLGVLDNNLAVAGYVEGVATTGSITIDSESDIRRTASLSMVVTSKDLEVGPDKLIWLDKHLQMWVGIESLPSRKIRWENCGIFMIDAPNYNYDSANATLTLSLLDLMATMTGARNGYLQGVSVVLKAGESIRGAIINTLAMAGFKRYIIEDIPVPGTLPFDLEFGQGATFYEVLKAVTDLYPNYQMYFDVEGVFHYEKIPTSKDDQISIDIDIFDSIVISESHNIDFQNIKNSIEVYGRTHDPVYYSADTTIVDNLITLSIPEVQAYEDNIIYGFTIRNPIGYTRMGLKINNLQPLPIMLEDGKTAAKIDKEQGEVYYCIQYKKGFWNWLGHLQAYALVEDLKIGSPYNINGTLGKIRLPLFGGDYDNIYSDDLARQRAERELFLHTTLNDVVDLTCVPVYWADVNTLVRYASYNSPTPRLYRIKSLTVGLGPTETMSVNMIKNIEE